jgi:hypothetical protein
VNPPDDTVKPSAGVFLGAEPVSFAGRGGHAVCAGFPGKAWSCDRPFPKEANSMSRTIRLAGLLALAISAAASTGRVRAAEPSLATDPFLAAQQRPDAIAYHDEWRGLWEDHVTWTRVVILGVVNGLPGTDDYVARLIQNYEDMEDALKPYFKDDDVEELGDLIQEHLVLAKQILDTVKAGGDATALIAEWKQNGTDIATQMSEMSSRWPFGEANEMWQDHLTATLEEATAEFTGDFDGAVAAYDEVVAMAREMADFFSEGVIKGKAKFKHENCVP